MRQCLRDTSYREYLTILKRIDEEWNQPNRSDYYMMQVAREVKRVLHSKPNDVQTQDFKIEFKEPEPPVSEEELARRAAAASKSTWLAFLGVDPEQ